MALSENITDRNFLLEVAKGKVPDHEIIHKFGAAESVGTALKVVATAQTYPTPTAAVSLEVVSSDNTNDIAAGTGARSVTVEGISNTNGVWTRETQVIALNGTTAVAIPNDMLRVFRAYIDASGAYATEATPSHNSTITIRVAGAGATWATITPFGTFGLGQSEIGAYTIPKGYKGYILSKNVSVESSKAANVLMFKRENADTVAAPFEPMKVIELERNLTGNQHVTTLSPLSVLTGPCDIGFLCDADSGTVDVSIDFEILLVLQ